MAELTLWHVPLSRSMRILWLLGEIGCAYDLRLMDLADGSTRRRPMTVHPVGRVPAARRRHHHPQIRRHDRMALRNPRPRLWRAPGAAGRLGWLDWLHFGETLGQHIANLTQQHVFLREDSQRSPP